MNLFYSYSHFKNNPNTLANSIPILFSNVPNTVYNYGMEKLI